MRGRVWGDRRAAAHISGSARVADTCLSEITRREREREREARISQRPIICTLRSRLPNTADFAACPGSDRVTSDYIKAFLVRQPSARAATAAAAAINMP